MVCFTCEPCMNCEKGPEMKKAIVALCCVFALSLALVGCSAGGAANPKAAWVGTWDLSEMESNGSTTSSEELETLRSLGLDVYMELNEDGTSALVLFGESMPGTWEAKSAEEATLTMSESSSAPITMKMADSKITMEQNGSKMVFKKGEKRTASSSSASASASASAASASASGSSSSSSAAAA